MGSVGESPLVPSEFIFALRTLRTSPIVALTAIVTIALGIGATTAVFSVAEAVFLRELPYTNSERLVVVSGEMRRRSAADLPLSGPDFADVRTGATRTFEGFAAVQTGRTLIPQANGKLEHVRFASVSPNFFRLLGGRIVIGRDFRDDDGESLPHADDPHTPFLERSSTVALLSYEYWQRRYGGSAAALGQRLADNGPEVLGVLAPRFELLFPPELDVERSPDVWLAARLSYDFVQRATFSHRVIGRLRGGVRLEEAQTEIDSVASDLRRSFPLWQAADFHIRLEPLRAYLITQIEPAVVALMGAAAFLLLIACANVANLLLVQASSRESELAVRAALGESRLRLVLQLLLEALVLAGAGTLIGIGLAWVGLRVLLAVAPPNLPRLDVIAINPVVLAFATLLGLAAAAVFGVMPALRGSRVDVMSVLRRRGGGLAGVRRFRDAVVVAEIALSFVLVIGSGLMLRSFVALQHIDPGFVSEGLLTFHLLVPRDDDPQRREAFMRGVHARLGAIPGVAAVTAASPFPLADRFYAIRWGTEEALTDASTFQAVDYQAVLPGYFEALQTPIVAGRVFTDLDNTTARSVAVIDRVLAAKAFPHEPAVGKRLLIRIRTREPEWVEVIGVVAHQRAHSLIEPGREQIYFTDAFLGHGAASRWAIRTVDDPAMYEASVRAAISEIGNRVVMTEVQTMNGLVRRSQAGTRFALLLIGVLASAAALLAAIGIYGALSTLVRQRTGEMGVRIAVGASPVSIFGLVVWKGLALSALGISIGLAGAFALTKTLASMLVGVTPTDPATFVAAVLLFCAIATGASSLPGCRAARLDPSVALRGE
jgi:predicted permease